MKQLQVIGFIFLIFGFAVNTSAQSKSYRMYNEFSEQTGCSQFSFSKSMIDIVNLTFDEESKKVTGDLHEIRFLSYNPQKGKMSGPQFLRQAMSYLPSTYRKVDLEDSDMDVVVLGNKKKASECHLFFKNSDLKSTHFLVSFYGNFNIDDIEKLGNIGKNLSNDNHE